MVINILIKETEIAVPAQIFIVSISIPKLKLYRFWCENWCIPELLRNLEKYGQGVVPKDRPASGMASCPYMLIAKF